MSAYSPNYCLKAFRAEARSHVLSWLSLLAVSYRVVVIFRPSSLLVYDSFLSVYQLFRTRFPSG